MAKSKIQQILSAAMERSSRFDMLEYVPIWFYSEDNELRIGEPVSESEIDAINPKLFKREGDIVYSGDDVISKEGKRSVIESLEDLYRDIRVFVDVPSRRTNDKHIVYEYSAYFQFDKFLNDVSNFTKLHNRDRRVKFSPRGCKPTKHNISENG